MNSVRKGSRYMAMLALGVLACGVGHGQSYYSGFEPPTYTAGSVISGTDGWYLPTTTGSVDAIVSAYATNPYSFPQNPRGKAQFFGNNNPGGTSLTRSQRDIAFGDRSYTMSWDTCVKFSGTLPGTQNVGSISLQDSTLARFFIALMVWVDPNTCANWSQQMNVYDAAGVSLVNQSPGTAFENLSLNNWYRISVSWKNPANEIGRITIQNLATGAFTSVNPTGWYLTGGSVPTLPLATGIRFFIGGTTAGNTVGFDNVLVGPQEDVPTSFTVTQGQLLGGTAAALADDDGSKVQIINDEFDSTAEVVINSTTSSSTASDMLLHIVCAAGRNDLSVFVAMQNKTTNAFVNVATSTSTIIDSDIYASVANPGNYVHSTGAMTMRLTWVPQNDIDAADGWGETIDAVHFHVTP